MKKEMKSVTVVNGLNNNVVVRAGETWMHGTYGVVTIDSIYRVDNKKYTTRVRFTTMLGEKYVAKACDLGAGKWSVCCNFIFKIK